MNRNKNGFWFWLFTLPSITILSLIVFVPFLFGIYYSFTDWNGINNLTNEIQFVGFKHYIDLFTDKRFFDAFKFTTLFAFVSVAIINAVALSLALLVTVPSKSSTFLRTVFFMPNLIGGLVLGFIWQFIFIKVFPVFGMLGWLSTTKTGFFGIIILTTWQMAGYMMIIYIAYLQSIPMDIIEASKIDGANYFQRFKFITIPLIAPAFTVSAFMTLSNSFKLYDQNLSLTNGGPFNSTEMLAMNIFSTAFTQDKMAYAQAKSVVFLLAVATITLTHTYINKKKEDNL